MAPSGLLTALGVNNDQLFNLFVVISFVTALGIAASALTVNPANLGRPIFYSVLLIAIGAFIDAHSPPISCAPRTCTSASRCSPSPPCSSWARRC